MKLAKIIREPLFFITYTFYNFYDQIAKYSKNRDTLLYDDK